MIFLSVRVYSCMGSVPLKNSISAAGGPYGSLSFSVYTSFHPFFKERFDIIDCQQFPYFSCFSVKFVSIVKKIPLVITWHEVWGDYWYEYLGWKGFVGKTTERLVARLTSENVSCVENYCKKP